MKIRIRRCYKEDPNGYEIGTVSPNFKITEDEVEKIIQTAWWEFKQEKTEKDSDESFLYFLVNRHNFSLAVDNCILVQVGL